MGSTTILGLCVLLALLSSTFAANDTYASVCSPWNSCRTCTATSVCLVGQSCVECGWCPSDGNCYVNPLDCTSWIPWNRTDLCPTDTPAHDGEELALFLRIEKIVLIVLGGLWALFTLVCILTCIGLRGRPRDFDSIMIDDFLNSDDSAANRKLV